MAETHYPPVSPVSAGFRCRCPRCGRGRLFKGFLDVVPRCAVCGLDLSMHDSGDGPAVFLIFILGALVVPLAILVEVMARPPMWVHVAIWPVVILGLALGMLRPAKALLIAIHYKNLRHEYDGG
jgi:uncharacterized protein (DUF983 family)